MTEDIDAKLDEALMESFPASDSIAITPPNEPWDNREENRFELTIDGHLSVIDYIRGSDVIALIHTGVPEALRGKGVANTLAEFALDAIRAEGLRVRPECPFIKTYIRRHPKYADLVEGA